VVTRAALDSLSVAGPNDDSIVHRHGRSLTRPTRQPLKPTNRSRFSADGASRNACVVRENGQASRRWFGLRRRAPARPEFAEAAFGYPLVNHRRTRPSERLRREKSHRARNVLVMIASAGAVLAVILNARRWLVSRVSDPARQDTHGDVNIFTSDGEREAVALT
jgi:hypothetical protein